MAFRSTAGCQVTLSSPSRIGTPRMCLPFILIVQVLHSIVHALDGLQLSLCVFAGWYLEGPENQLQQLTIISTIEGQVSIEGLLLFYIEERVPDGAHCSSGYRLLRLRDYR